MTHPSSNDKTAGRSGEKSMQQMVALSRLLTLYVAFCAQERSQNGRDPVSEAG